LLFKYYIWEGQRIKKNFPERIFFIFYTLSSSTLAVCSEVQFDSLQQYDGTSVAY